MKTRDLEKEEAELVERRAKRAALHETLLSSFKCPACGGEEFNASRERGSDYFRRCKGDDCGFTWTEEKDAVHLTKRA